MIEEIKDKPVKLKVEVMAEAFAQAYVRYGFNGAKAYKSIRTEVTDETAKVEASRILAQDNVRRRIMELLPKQSKARQLIHEALHAERPKNISWRDLHKYVETDLTLRGELDNKDKQQVNVGIILES